MLCPCAGLVASAKGAEVDDPASREDEEGCVVVASGWLSVFPTGLLVDELESGIM